MRWKCICAYDGTDFDGWQRQPGGLAVQNHIEAALSRIFDRPIQIQGSGRTDAGVHARGQCFHFDADWGHEPEKLIRALHSILPTSLRINSVAVVGDDFHARFSVKSKRYLYRYYLGRADPVEDRYVWACRDLPLNVPMMQAAADVLVGKHDFTAYSASHGKDGDPNPIKTVTRLDMEQRGRHVRLEAEGSGFLYRMVRSFAGALYAVGRGRLTPDDLAAILESRQRTHRIVTAPAKGLFLDRVFYD
ncbi:MAG: tRNA pseudouridine(38-40) synthase TruA [Puniceicoccaceae bacterium]|nr:MAG: tRNA pseudouridine(38-40) synthase TruA [Puniceicoccaceae bacterium]